MATEEAPSSSTPVDGGAALNPPPSSDIAASASSAIDFLTLCQRLKVTLNAAIQTMHFLVSSCLMGGFLARNVRERDTKMEPEFQVV